MSILRTILATKFWEPEEAIGTLWDSFAGKLDAEAEFPEAAVELTQTKNALGVLFRGLGGESGVEVKACGAQLALHRRSWRRRFASAADRIETARFDGSTLFLPERIACFADPDLNRDLYRWLAALAVVAQPCHVFRADPLQRDVARLRAIVADCRRAIEHYPGLAAIRRALEAATLAQRAPLAAPLVEAELESWIRARLAGEAPKAETPLERALAGDDEAFDRLRAPAAYKTYRPVLMWGERVAPPPPATGGLTARRRSPVRTAPTAPKKR
jgi:nitric oxide reductase NorD protein